MGKILYLILCIATVSVPSFAQNRSIEDVLKQFGRGEFLGELQLLIARKSNAHKRGYITHNLDGSVQIQFDKTKNCSADKRVDWMLRQHLSGRPELKSIITNYKIRGRKQAPRGYEDRPYESIHYYGPLGDDLNNYSCDVYFEFDNIRRVRVATIFDGDDNRQYWQDNLVAISYIPKDKVQEYSNIYHRNLNAAFEGYARVTAEFSKGVGRDFVWLSFPSDEWKMTSANYKPICYVGDAVGVVDELIYSQAVTAHDEVKFIGDPARYGKGGHRGYKEQAFASLADLYLAVQQKKCGNLLVNTSDANKLANGFKQIKIGWELGNTWLSEQSVSAATNAVNARLAEENRQRQLTAQRQDNARRAKQQAYDNCTATPSCKAERDAKRQAKRDKQMAARQAHEKRYPYIAEVSCVVNGQTTYWTPCFDNARMTIDGRTTTLNVAEAMNSKHASRTRDNLQFELSSKFQFMVQGSGDQYMAIRVVVKNRAGDVVFNDQKTGYGVIRVMN